ncbi:MAG: LytTR family DNA-binding domain-containing protein [Candidatus Izemoplasmatales bacterium]|nr:LytTR family DNA-binding domain-containing protein [Candidatus Izemoplasmatales bacterium]
MKIIVEDNKFTDDIEVVIKGPKSDDTVKEIYKSLLYFQSTIIGKSSERNYNLSLNNIYYFESVDNKTFAYDKDKVFEVNQRLYQLELSLKHTPFLRVNKNTIINTRKIMSFKHTINGRMEATLKNGEKMKISRNYVADLKSKLGGE